MTTEFHRTETGSMLIRCSSPDAVQCLLRGDYVAATIAQARSCATFKGKGRWGNHHGARITKNNRRSYSARVYHSLVRRALREAAFSA